MKLTKQANGVQIDNSLWYDCNKIDSLTDSVLVTAVTWVDNSLFYIL